MNRRSLGFSLSLLAAVALLLPAPASAETFNASPGDDIETMINALNAGDELILAGGRYELTERFSFSIAGTAAQPIIIRAADGESPNLHRPNASQNIRATR